MRISDWSSDVCSSDLDDIAITGLDREGARIGRHDEARAAPAQQGVAFTPVDHHLDPAVGVESHQRSIGQRETPDISMTRRIGLGSGRSEEHTSELQSLMRISYAVCCLKKKKIDHRMVHRI